MSVAWCLHACFALMLISQSQYPNLSVNFTEDAGSVRLSGSFSQQMHGDKQWPFTGVTNYGRVCRKGAGKWGLEYGAILIPLGLIKYIVIVIWVLGKDTIETAVSECTQRISFQNTRLSNCFTAPGKQSSFNVFFMQVFENKTSTKNNPK